MNEDVSPIENGGFPASHVSFRGCNRLFVPFVFFLLGGSNIFKHFPLSSDILGLKATPKKTIPKSVKKNVPYIYIIYTSIIIIIIYIYIGGNIHHLGKL